jgi:hypothetical protein
MLLITVSCHRRRGEWHTGPKELSRGGGTGLVIVVVGTVKYLAFEREGHHMEADNHPPSALYYIIPSKKTNCWE